MEKDGWKGIFLPGNKKMRSNVLLALCVGILLLAAGKGLSASDATEAKQEYTEKTYASAERETERRMAEILSGVEGAGNVDVMLTFRQTGEKSIARDAVREEHSGSLRMEETAVLLEDEAGATHPLVLTEMSPVAEGVIITAQGADSPGVAAALTQAAQALLDVPAHKVAVLKMK